MMHSCIRLSPYCVHLEVTEGRSGSKPYPAFRCMTINNVLINGKILLGTLEHIVVVGLYVLITLTLHRNGYGVNN
jgi:hypothetical protein